MRIVAGRRSEALAQEVADRLGTPLAEVERHKFPDGELYVRIPHRFDGEDVAVVASTRTNDDLVELLLLLDAVREQDAGRVVAAVPYYAYARQDQRFKEGEAFSADVVARMLAIYADGLLIVDPHKSSILASFDGDQGEVSAVPELAEYFQDKGVDLVLAPDAGARGRAQMAAEHIGVDHDHLEKTRIDAETVEMRTKDLDVSGKTVAIVDDIISTGGTMARAVAQLTEQGAKAVYCAATHGLLIGGGVEKLEAAGVAGIVVTDTIPGDHSRVSAAPALVRGLKAMWGVETADAVRP